MSYFYIIYNKKYKKSYVGSRSSNKIDILEGYITSSEIVKNIIKNEGFSDWNINEIKEFNEYKDAVEYENMFLRNIKDKENYFNINFSAGGAVIKSKSSFFITDGVKFKRISKDDILPEGWWKEHPNKPPSRKDQKRCENIVTKELKFFNKDDIPPGWVIYSLEEIKKEINRNKPKKNMWINNGIFSKKIHESEEIPRGYAKGRLFSSQALINIKKKVIINPKSGTKGKICINNGITNKYICPNKTIPPGYEKGLLRDPKY